MLTPRQNEILHIMATCSEEIVCGGLVCYVGFEPISYRSVLALLRCLAISDVSDTKGLQRYAINGAGRQILRRPALAEEIYAAVLAGSPFQIADEQIVPLSEATSLALGEPHGK